MKLIPLLLKTNSKICKIPDNLNLIASFIIKKTTFALQIKKTICKVQNV